MFDTRCGFFLEQVINPVVSKKSKEMDFTDDTTQQRTQTVIQSSKEVVESFGKWFIERFQGFSQVDVSKYLQIVKNTNVYGFVL
jgi:hypothetical protein